MAKAAPPASNNKTRPRFITFSYDALRYWMKESLDRHLNRPSIAAPLGILVTIIVGSAAADFRDFFFLNQSQWQLLAGVMAIGTLYWLIRSITKHYQGMSFDDMMDALYEISETEKQRRIVFFAKARDRDGAERILVKFDRVWQCYLLPHMEANDMKDVDDTIAAHFLSQSLSLSDDVTDISPIYGADLESYKKSESSWNDSVFYSFSFYAVSFRDIGNAAVTRSPSEIQGNCYKWMTIDELLSDNQTYLKNGDVLNHLKNNYGTFFAPTLPPCTDCEIEIRHGS